MPFDIKNVPIRLIKAAQQGNLVPLIGARISKQSNQAFPNLKELLNLLLNQGVKKKLHNSGRKC